MSATPSNTTMKMRMCLWLNSPSLNVIPDSRGRTQIGIYNEQQRKTQSYSEFIVMANFPPKAMTGINCKTGVTVDGSDDLRFKSMLLIGSCVGVCLWESFGGPQPSQEHNKLNKDHYSCIIIHSISITQQLSTGFASGPKFKIGHRVATQH